MTQFYTNLENLYNEHHYEPQCIWNINETKCQASQSGSTKVFAKRSIRGVHKVIPTEREWLSVLIAINANEGTIPHYYIFKRVKQIRNYVAYCKKGAMLKMQMTLCTPLML